MGGRLITCGIAAMLLLPVGAGAEIRTPAEWEPALGTLVRWPFNLPDALVVELARDDLLYVLVVDDSVKVTTLDHLAALGVETGQVVFVDAVPTSPWTRDWGPVGAYEDDGPMHLVDPGFVGYPNATGCAEPAQPVAVRRESYAGEDAVPILVGVSLGLPVRPMEVLFAGGNFMTDGRHTAWSTVQMFDENADQISEATFRERVRQGLGITDYRFLPNPEALGIQHIDCFAKLLDEQTVLVQQVAPDHPDFACSEAVAAAFEGTRAATGRRFRVERILCGRYDGDLTAAYTNSLILNRKVLVPLFGIETDAAALQTYRDLMPGYEVLGFGYGPGWFDYDALHCRTRAIFDPGMLHLAHDLPPEQVPADEPLILELQVRAHSGSDLVAGTPRLFWRQSGALSWQEQALTPAGTELFTATVPGLSDGIELEYWFEASDQSGRTETSPRSAPEGFHRTRFSSTATAAPSASRVVGRFDVMPTPFNPRTALNFDLRTDAQVRIEAFDARGRRLAVIVDRRFARGAHTVTWEGRDRSGQRLASGTYLLRLTCGQEHRITRATLVR